MMHRKMLTVLITVALVVSTTGCMALTKGSASWEAYGTFLVGVKTIQIKEPTPDTKPSGAGFESDLIDKIITGLGDGEISEEE